MATTFDLGKVVGPQGPAGANGTNGRNGADGADGKSAYEYAQEGGYTGTEAAFAQKLAKEFLPLSGGTLSGNIDINKASFPAVILDQTTDGTRVFVQNEGSDLSLNILNSASTSNNLRALQLFNSSAMADVASALRLVDRVNGVNTLYKLYGEHNKSLLQSTSTAVSLAAASWAGSAAPYTYNVTISGHGNMTDLVELMTGDSMTVAQLEAGQAANIAKAEWTSNTVLKLYAYGTKPTVALPVKINVRKL